jgi:hypothetical protein
VIAETRLDEARACQRGVLLDERDGYRTTRSIAERIKLHYGNARRRVRP